MGDLTSLDLNLLVVLDVLLEERSTTRTAERLGSTQPAVSRALKKLRAQLGDPLLVRSGNALVPTPRAQALSSELRKALRHLEQAVTTARFEPATSTRTFRISTADLAEISVLPPLENLLAREAPNVRLIVRSPDGHALEDLEAGALDLAFGPYHHAPPALRRQVLFHDDFVCVVRRGHPEVGTSLDLDTYVRLRHVLISPRGRARGLVDELLEPLGRTRQVALVVSTFLAAPTVVERTDLVLTVPRSVATWCARRGELELHEPPIAVPDLPVHQVWHERSQEDPGHAWFRRAVARALD